MLCKSVWCRLLPSLEPGPLQLLAVNRWRRWGAAFRFGVSANGTWVADTMLAQQSADGSWQDLSGGGARSSGWKLPWEPPVEGWDGEALLCLGTVGLVVHDDDQAEHELAAVSGFGMPSAIAIRIETYGETYDTRPARPLDAFVALAGGSGRMTLLAIDAEGMPVGVPRRIQLGERRRRRRLAGFRLMASASGGIGAGRPIGGRGPLGRVRRHRHAGSTNAHDRRLVGKVQHRMLLVELD